LDDFRGKLLDKDIRLMQTARKIERRPASKNDLQGG
jgi:hypothetical protein